MSAGPRVLLGVGLAAEDASGVLQDANYADADPTPLLRHREAHFDFDKSPEEGRRGAKNVPQQGKGQRGAPCARLLMSQMAMRGQVSEIRVAPSQRGFCDLSAPLLRQAQTISHPNRIVTATSDGL